MVTICPINLLLQTTQSYGSYTYTPSLPHTSYTTCTCISGLYFHHGTGSLYFLNIAESGYSTLERFDTQTGSRDTVLRNLQRPVDFLVDEENRSENSHSS